MSLYAEIAEVYIPEEVREQNVLIEQDMLFVEARRMPEFEFIALRNEQRAREIAALNVEEFFHGHGTDTLYPNDVLGYHRRYIALEQAGACEDELSQAAEARRHNVRVDFGEKMQAMTWDLPEPRAYRFGDDGRLYDGSYAIHDMFLGGLSALNNPIEGERRIQEAVNFSIIEAAGQYRDAPQKAFIEISMCNHEPGTNGYVTEIDKMQIRYSRYEDTELGRQLLMQPVYLDGRLFTDERMAQFAAGETAVIPREVMLSRMLVVDTQEYPDVLSFVAELDSFVSAEEGRSVFMGEYGAGDYTEIPELSARRYELFEDAIDVIDAALLEQAHADISPVEAELLLEEQQKRIALHLCKATPGLAKVVFNAETERAIDAVVQFEASGQQGRADEVFEDAVKAAPKLQGCGAACGLRDANESEKKSLERQGFKSFEDGSYKVDKYKTCPNPSCRKVGGVTYTSNGVFCLHCRGDKKSVKKAAEKQTNNH